MGPILGGNPEIRPRKKSPSLADYKTQAPLEENKTKNKAKKAEETTFRLRWRIK